MVVVRGRPQNDHHALERFRRAWQSVALSSSHVAKSFTLQLARTKVGKHMQYGMRWQIFIDWH